MSSRQQLEAISVSSCVYLMWSARQVHKAVRAVRGSGWPTTVEGGQQDPAFPELIWPQIEGSLLSYLGVRSVQTAAKRGPKFVDTISVTVHAGNGGAGCGTVWGSKAKGMSAPRTARSLCPLAACSFRTASPLTGTVSLAAGKFQPPDGGNGGSGGDIVVSASER